MVDLHAAQRLATGQAKQTRRRQGEAQAPRNVPGCQAGREHGQVETEGLTLPSHKAIEFHGTGAEKHPKGRVF